MYRSFNKFVLFVTKTSFFKTLSDTTVNFVLFITMF